MSRLDISIKDPCLENWDNFEKKGNVGFCSSCNKNVIDFTGYTDQEIIEFFKRDNGKTCGRFKQDQLKIYDSGKDRNSFNGVAAILAAGILTMAQVPEVAAQTKRITGKVLDETNAGIPGTNVLIKGTENGTVTDADGNFEVPYNGTKDDLTLVFSFIGYKTKERVLTMDGQFVNAGEVALEMDKSALREVVAGDVEVKRTPRFWPRIRSLFRN